MDTLKSIINDIDTSSTTKFGQHIICNLKNTMSDRAASEKQFHDLLETYRQQMLPLLYYNWDELSLSERNSCTILNNFYCGLHLLVNFSELADHVVNESDENNNTTQGVSKDLFCFFINRLIKLN